jgi:hypothetical protein
MFYIIAKQSKAILRERLRKLMLEMRKLQITRILTHALRMNACRPMDIGSQMFDGWGDHANQRLIAQL